RAVKVWQREQPQAVHSPFVLVRSAMLRLPALTRKKRVRVPKFGHHCGTDRPATANCKRCYEKGVLISDADKHPTESNSLKPSPRSELIAAYPASYAIVCSSGAEIVSWRYPLGVSRFKLAAKPTLYEISNLCS